jgi:tRNA C32,U32 (ribose-2'-O)-methylase TrmJ
VIKSKIFALEYLSDLICDNLWAAAVNLNNYIIADASCKKHNNDHDHSQQHEFLVVELDEFKEKLVRNLQRVGLHLETLIQLLLIIKFIAFFRRRRVSKRNINSS